MIVHRSRDSKAVPLAALVAFLLMGGTALPSAAATAAKSAPAHAALAVPFISDDYDKALELARTKNLPLVVDAWATWCHTCRSMKAFVFTDPSLAPRADQFVWLLMDVENPKNAALKAKLPANALPTFFVVNPADEKVARRWVGGMTIAQFQAFLDEGQAVVAAGGSATPGVESEAGHAALARADRAYGDGDYKAAAAAYGEALPLVAPGSDAYPRVVEAAMYSYVTTDQNEQGIALAEQSLNRLGRTTSAASIAGSALSCALSLPADAPGRAEAIAKYEALTKDLLADPTIAMADDDRSSTYGLLMDARTDAKDEAGAKQAALVWATFDEGAAARAKNADERAVFDSHRLAAYLELGTPEKAIPMLQASEKALPNDYNPPARLAVAYNAMHQWDDALAATNRALAKAYGPRKLRIYQARADAYAGKGDNADAKKTLDDAIAYAKALPEGQRSESSIAALTKKRDGIGAVAAGEGGAK
jgi:thiol-disulfide isomerase/thioredoxin